MNRRTNTVFTLIVTFLLLLAPRLTLGKSPPLARLSKTDQKRLNDQLKAVLAQPDLAQMAVGVKVVSLDTGEILLDHQAGRLFHPGSNTKLFTAIAALRTLGPDYRFLTSLYGDDQTDIRGDTLQTALYLQGTGDPTLTTAAMDSLAACIAAYGASVISGPLVVDESYFDTKRLGEGWMWDDAPYDFSAQVSAMTLNRNCVTVVAMPGKAIGQPVLARVAPPNEWVKISSTALTGKAETQEPFRVERRWQERSNTVDITGELPIGSADRSVLLSIEDPALYAAYVFRERLALRGITVSGAIQKGSFPLRARLLGRNASEPLPAIIRFMLKDSDNLAAELLVKAMGRHGSGQQGSTENGLKVLRKVLAAVAGLDTLGYLMADGSGLSRYDLITPNQTIALLTKAYRDSTLRMILWDALPVAGVDGTLKNRMRSSPAKGVLRAKTGSLSGVSCLSGFVTTGEEETLVFSIMMNNFVGSSSGARRAQDDLGATFATFSRKKKSR